MKLNVTSDLRTLMYFSLCMCISLIIRVSPIVCVHEHVCVVPPDAGSRCCYTPLSGSPPHSHSVCESSGQAHSQGQGQVAEQRPPPSLETDTPSLCPCTTKGRSYYTRHTNSGWSQASASPINNYTKNKISAVHTAQQLTQQPEIM